MDYKTVNESIVEDRAYRAWEREQKNRILAMTNPTRKQEAWDKVFPRVEQSDDWMLAAHIF